MPKLTCKSCGEPFDPNKFHHCPAESKDPVSHPSHYNSGKIEVIEFIEDQIQNVDFHKGNALKYISRAGKKNPEKEIEDLKKAAWYINRAVEVLESKKEGRTPLRPNDMNKKGVLKNEKDSVDLSVDHGVLKGDATTVAQTYADTRGDADELTQRAPTPKRRPSFESGGIATRD